MIVIDTDTNCSHHLEHLRAEGVTHIGRYYARAGTKRLTKTEAQILSDAGLDLFIVYEDSGDPELSVDRGRNDAQLAYSQARSIAQPANSAIYFAMEHLPNGYDDSHIPGVKLYFEGIRRTLKDLYKVGCYSNGTTLAALLDAKLIDYAWVSASTSFHGSHEFLKTDRWHLAQKKVDLNWQGVSVDTNDVKHEDFGAFRLPPIAAPETVAAVTGAAAGLVQAEQPPPATVAKNATTAETDRDQAPETAGGWFKDWSFAKVNDLAEQGSRLAQHIRDMTAGIWKRRAVGGGVSTTAATVVAQSPAATSWIAAHPFLSLALAVGSVVLAYEVWDQVQAYRIRKGLLSAAKDGRYVPRGGVLQPAQPAQGA